MRSKGELAPPVTTVMAAAGSSGVKTTMADAARPATGAAQHSPNCRRKEAEVKNSYKTCDFLGEGLGGTALRGPTYTVSDFGTAIRLECIAPLRA